MKKITTTTVCILLALNAMAQHSATRFTNKCTDARGRQLNIGQSSNNSTPRISGARTTAVSIAGETFGTGTRTTLPTGWTTGIINGTGAWHWTKDSSTSGNSLGYMHSTTAADGWMIFDADSLQNDCSCAPSAWLQSPAYNCSGHTTVRLNFEEYFGMGEDTCEVWVGTTPTFTTHTTYPVTSNNVLPFFGLTSNTQMVHINISTAAAGMSSVYIRYVFKGNSFLEFSWMVDDMSLTELDAHDAGVAGSFLLAPDASAYNGSVASVPLAFVDGYIPGSLLSNYGYTNETAVPATADIYLGTGSVYSHSISYPSLVENATDSVIYFPSFTPSATGSYICAISSGLSGDADATNNKDTVRFNVTDTTWMQNDTVIGTNYFVFVGYGTFGPGSPAMAGTLGTRFDVPATSAGDTVSGFGVAFSFITPPTNPGAKVSVQLYGRQKGDTGWVYQGTSIAKALASTDISTDTTIVWTDFRIDTAASGGITPFILKPGYSYVAMIQTFDLASNLLVFASDAPKVPGMEQSIAYSDTSHNDGSHRFHTPAGDTGISGNVPFVRMYFGNVPVAPIAVPYITRSNIAGHAYPDPANTVINIPVISAVDADARISVYDITGREVRSTSLLVAGNKKATAVLSTADLADGEYFYKVTVNGTEHSEKFVVAH